jgi:hypothetical protein
VKLEHSSHRAWREHNGADLSKSLPDPEGEYRRADERAELHCGLRWAFLRRETASKTPKDEPRFPPPWEPPAPLRWWWQKRGQSGLNYTFRKMAIEPVKTPPRVESKRPEIFLNTVDKFECSGGWVCPSCGALVTRPEHGEPGACALCHASWLAHGNGLRWSAVSVSKDALESAFK